VYGKWRWDDYTKMFGKHFECEDIYDFGTRAERKQILAI
jgi:hypothetical protein